MAARGKISDQNKSLGVNYLTKNYQIWAADVDTRERRLLLMKFYIEVCNYL